MWAELAWAELVLGRVVRNSGNRPPKEKDYSTVEKSGENSSFGHHCISGSYNIGRCVMTW